MKVSKTRKIRLAHANASVSEQIEKTLSNLDGVQNFNFDPQQQILTVTYDLEKIMFKTIESLLQSAGIRLDNNWFSKMKRNWHNFTEQNELDNLHVNPTCCSDPPEIIDQAKVS
ncbi:MAG: cation transporter [Calditrichaeota bacterium]|nr:cation transporter [Calditrichota bacterium]